MKNPVLSFKRNQTLQFASYFFFFVFCFFSVFSNAESDLERVKKQVNNALLLLDQNKKIIASHHAETPLVPASTLKILTALMALERWGRTHQFHTDFYLTNENQLWIVASGDPFITSEEIDRIVKGLLNSTLAKVNSLAIDQSIFAEKLVVDGQSTSLNPYDAPLSALAVNFNTINIGKTKEGEIYSPEAQTPLTPLHREMANVINTGKARINLQRPKNGPLFFSQILISKLSYADPTRVNKRLLDEKIHFGNLPANAKRIYRHVNHTPLEDQIRAMLKYSTNFVANQLFLLLAVENYQQEVTMQDAQDSARTYIDKRFAWKNTQILEGAGLSRQNRLSAQQLIELLEAFAPYRDLLPQQSPHLYAKTGSLKGIRTYAGYFFKSGDWFPFALLLNHPGDAPLRDAVTKALWEKIASP